jgi:plastocyanin
MRIKLLGWSLVLTFLLLFFSAVAGATILTPSTLSPSAAPAGTETGTLVAEAIGNYNTITTVAGKQVGIAGEVIEGVYSETNATSSVCPVGQSCLDFVYQFTQTNANGAVTSFNASDFDNAFQWTTDVYQSSSNTGALSIFSAPTAAGTNPNSVTNQRGGTGPDQGSATGGDTVTFVMNDGGTHPVPPGVVAESNIFIVKTNAPLYVPGSVSLLANHTATSYVGTGNPNPWASAYCQGCTGVQGFTSINNPTNTGLYALNGVGYSNTFLAPIPEPGFYGVLAIGLAGLFVAVKYRRGKQTA